MTAPSPHDSTYHGLYYDGRSSTAHPVRVLMEEGALHLHLQGPATDQVVQWSLGGIHSNHMNRGGNTQLKYGPFPHQMLEVKDADFWAVLQQAYPGHSFTRDPYGWIYRYGARGLAAVTLVMLLTSTLYYFFVLPEVAEFMGRNAPPAVEKELGAAVIHQVLDADDIDSVRTAHLAGFMRHLSRPGSEPVQVYVVKSAVPNAFAVPGGHIVVFTALLDSLPSPAALAALMGHEYTHISEKHTMRSLYRAAAHSLFWTVLIGDATSAAALVIDNAQLVNQLSFSRSMELEADEGGRSMLEANQMDPRGMVQLFEVLGKETRHVEEALPQWLSSHPQTEERLQRSRSFAAGARYEAQPSDSLSHYFALLQASVKPSAPSGSLKP